VPAHAAGNVTVRIYRDHRLVAEMIDAFEYRNDSIVDFENPAKNIIAMRIRLRHVVQPPDHRAEVAISQKFFETRFTRYSDCRADFREIPP